MSFSPFDPLEFKHTKVNEAALSALKREIENILSSYVGWYDPFCELIQNSLDAVEARTQYESAIENNKNFSPKISILIDIDNNALTVTDNGIGLDREKFEQFLAPNFSFKSPTGNTRGHKGVGATYVAYGFNYMRISTKVPGFEATGRIVNARTWLKNNSGESNPKVEPDDTSPHADPYFNEVDRGVSITVRFDKDTHPKQLSWPRAETAEVWAKILSIKTGIGSIKPDQKVTIEISVQYNNKRTHKTLNGTKYFWLHENPSKSLTFMEIATKHKELSEKQGLNFKFPNRFLNLDFIYENWNSDELKILLANSLNEEELNILDKHTPTVTVEFGFSAKLWSQFNNSLGLRNNIKILNSGIQLAANNMPQGEVIQVPLNRNIGRQNQVHFLIHFNNYTPDLGRKGFHQELVDFSKEVSRQIVENQLSKYRKCLKQNTGIAPDLSRKLKIDEWKRDFIQHEEKEPLSLKSKFFFLPIERISITSVPTREQDVIALFHQLIAGGVIRGINIMSTNERFVYDGLFKIVFDLNKELYLYNKEKNPLGISNEIADTLDGKISEPYILEYKYSLDGLIEDIDNQDKNLKEIDLCIAWNTGDSYHEKYDITSLLIPENTELREYHGITHYLTDRDSGNKLCELIILSELIEFLNDPETSIENQRKKYELYELN